MVNLTKSVKCMESLNVTLKVFMTRKGLVLIADRGGVTAEYTFDLAFFDRLVQEDRTSAFMQILDGMLTEIEEKEMHQHSSVLEYKEN